MLAPYITNTDYLSSRRPTTAPHIQVLSGTTVIANGTGSVAFGSTPVGTPISQTFGDPEPGERQPDLDRAHHRAGRIHNCVIVRLDHAGPRRSSTTFVVKINATVGGTYSR